jgi:uncharacterized protein YoxC
MDAVGIVFNLGVGIGLLLVGAGLLLLAVATLPLVREMRALIGDARRLSALAEEELRPILAHGRELAANLEVLTEDVAVKLDRLNDLMNALQRSLDEAEPAPILRRRVAGPVESADVREEERWP